jgi:hypothetical protein
MNQNHYAAVRYALVIGFIAGGIDQFENPSLTAGFTVAALHSELLTPLIEALRQNPELVELSRKVGLGHLFGSFSGGNGHFSGGNGHFSGRKTKQSPKSQIIHDFFAVFDKLSNDNKTALDVMVKKLAPAFLTSSSLARRKTAKTRQ